MNCQFCGSQLAKEARTCANCGNLAPDSYANKDIGGYGPTAPSGGAQQSAALYSSNPYSEQSNPYSNSSFS